MRRKLKESIVVWMARLSESQDDLPNFAAQLSPHEQQRAKRFHFPDDRARFVLGRGLLRKCLSQHLGLAPETIELTYTERDRPILAHDPGVQFSITHSHDLVALAFTTEAQVGIDIEYMRADWDVTELAPRILSHPDLARFHALPDAEKASAFFRIWTRKEAYLKARGEGIAERLDQISVSFGSEEISAIKDSRLGSSSECWRIHNLSMPAGYLGNIACDDPQKRIDLFSYP